MAHAVESVGYRFPRTPIVATVHSVFARACNIAWRDTLLTLCTAHGAQGPNVLRLAAGGPADLRAWLEVGERLDGTGRCLRTARATFDLSRAAVWRPVAATSMLPLERAAANVARARARLADRRTRATSVIDAEAAPCVAALVDACRRLDDGALAPEVHRLVGWGEGLTPAGDDVLAGFMAALDAPALDDPGRRRFRDGLRAACLARTSRTTPISAAQLRLAAEGHHGAPALAARDALLYQHDARALDAALDDALTIGATSGAAMLAGLIGALEASLPAAHVTEHRP